MRVVTTVRSGSGMGVAAGTGAAAASREAAALVCAFTWAFCAV